MGERDVATAISAPPGGSAAPAKRGRPRSIDRDLVVDVAMRLYWAAGTDGVSFNELCRVADVSKPAVYREFGGEDGLMDAALDHYAQVYLAPVYRHTTQDAPFGVTLGQLIDSMIDGDPGSPPGCLLAKMRVLSSDLGVEARARVVALQADACAYYAVWVDHAKSRGEFPTTLATGVAATFIDSQLTWLLMQVALGGDPAVLREHAHLTFAGLLARARAS